MSGFSPDLFVDSVDADFICSICHGVFKRPVICQDGHSFCKECIRQWQLDHCYCPVDRSELYRPLIRNRAVEGAIGRIIIRCPSTISVPGGCSWTGPTASMENHLPQCDIKMMECRFKERGCIFRAYQPELAAHHRVCPHRTVECHTCSAEILHSDLAAHEELCVYPEINPEDRLIDDEGLNILKEFDLDSRFGACIGITRLERWERAKEQGLNPPETVKTIVLKHPNDAAFTEWVWFERN